MSSTDTQNVLRLARAYAAQHLPWFAPALYRCKIILTEKVAVAAIDKHYNVYWNPESVKATEAQAPDRATALAELAFVWVHEISHVLRDHESRRQDIGGRPNRWNFAADLEINDAQWAGTSAPTAFPPVTPQDFKLPENQLAEWYYRDEKSRIAEQLSEHLDCGSGAHGEAREWEVGTDGQSLTDTQREVVRRDVAERLRNAPPGSTPGGWKQWIEDVLDPKTDWRQLLRQRLATAIAVGSGARVDYSFARPGRRQSIYQPVILPTLTGATRSQLAVVIDTSGSMSGSRIRQAAGEIYGILQQAHQHVTLIPADAAAYAPILLRSLTDFSKVLSLPGGGGTDLRPGIEAALKLQPAPDAILVLTDGEIPWPETTYSVPVLFGIVNQELTAHNRPPNPPWGEDSYVFVEVE